MKIQTKKRYFMITLGLLIVYFVLGTVAVSRCSEDSADMILEQTGTVIAALVSIVLVGLAIRFFPEKKKAAKFFGWLFGIIIVVWMLSYAVYCVSLSFDSGDVYGSSTRQWIAYVDKLEVEKNVWDKSRWFGRGEEVYDYTYGEYAGVLKREFSDRKKPNEIESAILNERDEIEYTFMFYDSDTILNVLSYMYGKWVLLVYMIDTALMLGLALLLLPEVGKLPQKLLYLAAWVLLAVIFVLPGFNGGAVWYSYWGPPFSGAGSIYRVYNVLVTGPAIGVVLGLIFRVRIHERVLNGY